MTTRPKTLGERVKTLRTARGWSQDALARETGMTKSHVQYIEAGKTKNPGYPTIKLYADALGVDPMYLLTGRERSADDKYPAWARGLPNLTYDNIEIVRRVVEMAKRMEELSAEDDPVEDEPSPES